MSVPIFHPPDVPKLGPPVPLRHVVEITAEAFGCSVEDLVSPRRLGPLVHARQVGMHVARELGFALVPITRAFGRMDHTTTVHALERVKASDLMMSEAAQLLAYLREEVAA